LELQGIIAPIMEATQISRRESLKWIGTGALGLMAGPVMGLTGGKTHLITLSFDDGFEKSSIKTAEIYEKYGLSACINIIASAHTVELGTTDAYHKWPVGDFVLWNELKKRGHEIMPHSYKHANLTQMPLEEAKQLVNRCSAVFSEELQGFIEEESVFNLPYNASTPKLEAWLKTKFRAIRTGGDPVNPLPHKELFRLGCTSFGPGNIDEHLESTIQAFLKGPPGWLVYNTHGIDDEGWGPVSAVYLEELLDRLNGLGNVSIMPVIPALDSI
jgi:peptidoglycan/xylan/chitin deacetylase (PgdA/CDA1 family)